MFFKASVFRSEFPERGRGKKSRKKKKGGGGGGEREKRASRRERLLFQGKCINQHCARRVQRSPHITRQPNALQRIPLGHATGAAAAPRPSTGGHGTAAEHTGNPGPGQVTLRHLVRGWFNTARKTRGTQVKAPAKPAWHSRSTRSLCFYFTTKSERGQKGHVPVPESTAAGNVNIWRGEKKKATKDQMMW